MKRFEYHSKDMKMIFIAPRNITTPMRKPEFSKEQHLILEEAKEEKRDVINTQEVWDD